MDQETIETLWREFAVETDEHIQVIEPLLASIAGPQPPTDDIATLFRSFHSLKGLARAMALKSMEVVAHRCETLLGQVRDHGRPCDDASVSVLLEAVDVLGALRDRAVRERQDGALPEDLVGRLEALAADGAAAAPAIATPGPAPAAAVSVPRPAAAPPLVADADMAAYFAELVSPLFADLGEVLCRWIAGGGGPDAGKAAEPVLDSLDHASTVMGFYNVSMLLQALRRRLEAAPQEAGTMAAVVRLACEVGEDLDLIARETGCDPGADRFRAALMPAAEAALDCLRRDLAAAFALFAGERTDGRAACAGGTATALAAACVFFASRQAHVDLALLVSDVLVRKAHGGLPYDAAVHGTVAAAVEVLLSDDADIDPRSAAEAIRQALVDALGGADADATRALVLDAMRKDGVPEDLLSALTPESLSDAAKAFSGGASRALVIVADINGRPELARAFVAWLRSVGHPVTNRTLFRDGKTMFQFAVLTRAERQEVLDDLRGLDPEGTALSLVEAGRRSPAGAEGQEGPPREDARRVTVVRVPGETIDLFLSQIGEMVLTHSALSLALENERSKQARAEVHRLIDLGRKGAGLDPAAAVRLARLMETLDDQIARLAEADQQLHGGLQRLQERALDLRVLPIDTVFNRFPRVVRDIAKQTGKTVRLEMGGREARIDKGMVELLVDPLMHMVRNAVDHGIESPEERRALGKPETGVIRLEGLQRGNHVVIDISDDGRGLDANRLRAKAVERGLLTESQAAQMSDQEAYHLIFRPGFSTAAVVTETSGRGVGMDVVHTNVVGRLGGRIEIRAQAGRGSTFTLTLPLSAAIQDALLVEAGHHVLAVPDRYLVEVQDVRAEDIQTVRGQRALLLRETFLPVFRLTDLLGGPDAAEHERAPASAPVLVVSNGRQRMGLEVDRLFRRQELYVKDIHPRLAAIPGVGGASVLGDGRVVLILDVDDLFHLAAADDAAEPADAAPLPLAAE